MQPPFLKIHAGTWKNSATLSSNLNPIPSASDSVRATDNCLGAQQFPPTQLSHLMPGCCSKCSREPMGTPHSSSPTCYSVYFSPFWAMTPNWQSLEIQFLSTFLMSPEFRKLELLFNYFYLPEAGNA